MEKLKEEYEIYKSTGRLITFYQFICQKYETPAKASEVMNLATTAELRRYSQHLDNKF